MKLLVVGANGGLGRQVVTHSLERGHQVTALVRRGAGQADTPGLRPAAERSGTHLSSPRGGPRSRSARPGSPRRPPGRRPAPARSPRWCSETRARRWSWSTAGQ
ncbi:NmrA family NAD(P)-binding protein [Streptomyces acidicola]